jgi:hypothetical protein
VSAAASSALRGTGPLPDVRPRVDVEVPAPSLASAPVDA